MASLSSSLEMSKVKVTKQLHLKAVIKSEVDITYGFLVCGKC